MSMFFDSEKKYIRSMVFDLLKHPKQTLLKFIQDPIGDGVVCQIGEHWFYFSAPDAKLDLSFIKPEDLENEIKKAYPEKEANEILADCVANAIFEIYEDLAKNEAMYYVNFMRETLNELNKKPVTSKCRHALPRFGEKGEARFACLKDAKTKEDEKPVDQTTCENCPDYDNKYIKYPIDVNAIIYGDNEIHGKPCLCRVRPCGEKYKDKTFLGIYLGDLMLQPSVSHVPRTGILEVNIMHNPCIFIPELMEIVWGCGSWWSRIDSETDLKDITDETIDAQWYVKMLQAASGNNQVSKTTEPIKEESTNTDAENSK